MTGIVQSVFYTRAGVNYGVTHNGDLAVFVDTSEITITKAIYQSSKRNWLMSKKLYMVGEFDGPHNYTFAVGDNITSFLKVGIVWIWEVTLYDDSLIVEINNGYVTNKLKLGTKFPISRAVLIRLGISVNIQYDESLLHTYPFPTMSDIKKAVTLNPQNLMQLGPEQFKFEICEIIARNPESAQYILNPNKDIITKLSNTPEYKPIITVNDKLLSTLVAEKIDWIRKLKLTTEQLTRLYDEYGVVAMYYANEIPENIQLDMITKDPRTIWCISNPSKQVINYVQKLNIPCIWVETEKYYSPVFSFKWAFENFETSTLTYELFCQHIIDLKGIVYGDVVLSQLIGSKQGSVNVLFNNIDNAFKFKDMLVKNEYVYTPEKASTLTCDQLYNGLIIPLYKKNTIIRITITIVQSDPINFIMTASKLDIYRLAFDGVGLWTGEKLLGQNLKNVTINPIMFDLCDLMNNKHELKMLLDDIKIHVGWANDKCGFYVTNYDEFVDTTKRIKYRPMLMY